VKTAYKLARAIGHAEWLRLGIRRRLVKQIAPPHQVKSAEFDVRFRGGSYRGDIANMQEWHVYFFDGYELKELALIRDILQCLNQPVAMDIGANLGGHTLVMARHAAHVHSFEPYLPLADRITEQLKLNGHDHVTVYRVGLGEEAAELPYFLDKDSRNQGTGSFLSEHNHADAVATLTVVRGDDYVTGKIDTVDFVKIDIEGYEAPALAGLKMLLGKTEPVIMMEITQSSARLFEEYGGYGAVLPFAYQLFRVENPTYPLGLFQASDYRLTPLDAIVAERNSYNVLIVPGSRAEALHSVLPMEPRA
jgi:FkbM family methyltransferase